MRTLSAPVIAALSASNVTIVQLIYMQFPGGAIALNTSTWDIVFSGVTYRGAFGLGSVTPTADSPGGEVKGLSFEMSGVDPTYIALALDDAGTVQGTPVTIRTAILDTNYQVVDAPVEWDGRMDTMSIEENGDTCTIGVTAESTAVDLLRGNPLTYSDADQQSLYPGDLAFQFVVGQANTPVVWPAKAWFVAMGPRG